jgi:hypothetical protein
MFTQFFGSYLLNKEYITMSQLIEVLEYQKSVRLKLGVLAINAGYMSADQVNKVHRLQLKIDKMFGNIAVEMGYLTDDQVAELLKTQNIGYIILGQALVDKGYITNMRFENAIEEYKKECKIKEADFTSTQNEKMLDIIENFYEFEAFEDAALYTEYIWLLFKNLVRFIGDDFIPMKSITIRDFECKNFTSQTMDGEFSAYTALETDNNTLIKFASKFSNEDYTETDDYVKASFNEFMSLTNGIFCVNMSNSNRMELDLTPQVFARNRKLLRLKNAFCIPIKFSFGIINFIIAGNIPTML